MNVTDVTLQAESLGELHLTTERVLQGRATEARLWHEASRTWSPELGSRLAQVYGSGLCTTSTRFFGRTPTPKMYSIGRPDGSGSPPWYLDQEGRAWEYRQPAVGLGVLGAVVFAATFFALNGAAGQDGLFFSNVPIGICLLVQVTLPSAVVALAARLWKPFRRVSAETEPELLLTRLIQRLEAAHRTIREEEARLRSVATGPETAEAMSARLLQDTGAPAEEVFAR